MFENLYMKIGKVVGFEFVSPSAVVVTELCDCYYTETLNKSELLGVIKNLQFFADMMED